MHPLISVIIPVYKVEAYIAKCVDSVLSQTYANIEIILVDDGSPDGCYKICEDYVQKDHRVKVIHKENGGLSSARNAGLDIARGEYIGFVDSDDYIAADMYQKLLEAIKKEKADLAICDTVVIYEKEDVEVYKPLKDETLNKFEAFEALLDGFNVITVWNKLYSKHIFKNLRFPDGRIHEDEFIVHRVFNACAKIVTISDKLYYYVKRQGGIMLSGYTLKRLDAWYAFYDRYLFFRDNVDKRQAKIVYRCCYEIIMTALQKIDMSVSENKKVISTLFWRTFFGLLRNGDLRAGKLLLVKIKGIYSFLKNIRSYALFISYESCRKLQKKVKQKRIIIFNIPEHGNIGDIAIAVAEYLNLSDYIKQEQICQITNKVYLSCFKHFYKSITNNDVIMIHGGGFLGTLWISEEEICRDIIQRFPDNKIIIFPQTIYFEDSEYGKEQLEISKNIWQSHRNLYVCLRERNSYEFVIENMVGGNFNNAYLIPDIVLYLNKSLPNLEREGVLFCFRKDKEKVFSEHDFTRLTKTVLELKESIVISDTVIDKPVRLKEHEAEFEKKINEFKSAKLVITDRLHGMIFAAITGTPCIAFNNLSKKVEGVYDFIDYLDYIVFVQSIDEALQYMERLLNMGRQKYDNAPLMPYFRLLAQLVEENV